ncbi:MAG: transposase [Patescibacteria group bacterium]
MQRNYAFAVGEYYHLYNRGVEKRKLFLDGKCRDRFVSLLHLCNGARSLVFKEIQGLPLDTIDVGERLVAIGAYCLMPNHIHLLVREIKKGGISRFMGKLLTAYSMYFNKRYERRGRLFENNFKARHAHFDQYLKYLYAYIHLNPVKLVEPSWRTKGIQNPARAKRFLSAYAPSSYLDYQRVKRPENIILDRRHFPEYFQQPLQFEHFLNDWLTNRDIINPRVTLG